MHNAPATMWTRGLAVALTVFTLAEVNYPNLRPESQLAIFAGLGLMLCYLRYPLDRRFAHAPWSRWLDRGLAGSVAMVCGYMVTQSEPLFQGWWLGGSSLGDRAGIEQRLDLVVGVLGLVLVLEAARRTVGWALPILAITFLLYAMLGPSMPDWLFPHRGYDLQRIVAQTFLHSQGVFGTALRVMFFYVFLFVVFGALLEATGATAFVIDAARRLFKGAPGAPAKVAVLSSGLMGSLSGSAVANTATTGTFTIPLMKSAGFKRHVAAGVEAASSAGGALMPPVMGAGAYMMLEIIDPPVTYLEIVRAALLPALLYYLSLFLIVHFHAKRIGASASADDTTDDGQAVAPSVTGGPMPGLIFVLGLGTLIACLLSGFTVFRAVSLAMAMVLVLATLDPRTRVGPKRLMEALHRAANGGIALVAAAASVGIVIGVVTLTGVGSKLPAAVIPLAEQNLFLALLLIMGSSLVLGMGLPSAVCYLLLATLIGPALGGLGVVPIAAHLFIFYFGLMSMVTPPVALAAYTAASIAGSKIMRTAMAAFRFALVGFALPFLFVYRPALLMLAPDGGTAPWLDIALTFGLAAAAVVGLAATITGYFGGTLGPGRRFLLAAITVVLFVPGLGPTLGNLPVGVVDLMALVGLGILAMTGGAAGESRSADDAASPPVAPHG